MWTSFSSVASFSSGIIANRWLSGAKSELQNFDGDIAVKVRVSGAARADGRKNLIGPEPVTDREGHKRDLAQFTGSRSG
jgi:hypothetical protein